MEGKLSSKRERNLVCGETCGNVKAFTLDLISCLNFRYDSDQGLPSAIHISEV